MTWPDISDFIDETLDVLSSSPLYVDPAATISDIDLEFLSASSGESTVYRTAKSILTTLPAEAFALYDLAQSLDAKTARDLWFSGDGKVYRLAADAIIIDLAVRRSCAQAAERGELGLIEACAPDGARLDEADYLWPKHPQLYPRYQLITRPLALQATDDIYTRVTGALRDTLAFDTATVIERLGQLPADAPLRVVHDQYQLTNNFSVKFMNFKRFRQARETCPADREADSAETANNPLPSLIPGIDTGVRIMVRLVRLVFDKFEASLQRLPTAEEIGTVLVANLRQSHQLLTMLARVNLIEVNTRNYVLTGSTGHWYQPELFIYKHTTRGAAAPWSGDLATLHEYGLAPSPLAVQQFHQTTPRKEIVRAVGGHSQTDGCPARAPLNLASMAGELGLVHAGAVASEQGGKEDANAILAIFHHLLVPLAPYVYEVDRRQRLALLEAAQASQRQRAERAQRDAEQAERVERIRREILIQNPDLSKKALERLVARRLAEQNTGTRS